MLFFIEDTFCKKLEIHVENVLPLCLSLLLLFLSSFPPLRFMFCFGEKLHFLALKLEI